MAEPEGSIDSFRRLLNLAEEARTRAEGICDPASRANMLQVAKCYEHLARRAQSSG